MYFWNMQNEKVKVKYFSENESDFSQIILFKSFMDVCVWKTQLSYFTTIINKGFWN